MKLALDEHFSPSIAQQLRARGYDVVAISELAERRGLRDRDHFEWAIASGRVFVTEDVVDFMELFSDAVFRGRSLPGLLFTSGRRFSRSERAIGSMVEALARILETHDAEHALPGGIAWLES